MYVSFVKNQRQRFCKNMIGAAGLIDWVLSCKTTDKECNSVYWPIGNILPSDLARAVCPWTLLIESWGGSEGAVQDASVHGMAGM